jgi:hypothetical protein
LAVQRRPTVRQNYPLDDGVHTGGPRAPLLIKVVDQVLYKLDDLVHPYIHKILVVIKPLLIDEDYYTCVKSCKIISNLST